MRLRNGESTLNDWKSLSGQVEQKLTKTELDGFNNTTFILTKWTEVNTINMELRQLNVINAIHTGGKEAKKADNDVAIGLEAQLLLARGARVMLTANLWTEAGLVNGAMGTIQDLLFEDQEPPLLPIAVLISFDNYKGPTIDSLEEAEVVPIGSVRHTWEGKTNCSRLQIPVRLAWAITVHKS
jgi:ATP-dependent DNA helicase PIF1